MDNIKNESSETYETNSEFWFKSFKLKMKSQITFK